ncbi:MAG: c-type cytochrome [Chitinophagales bacterium]|nr:c-type cytochrome [Chitinophagales bacterium]
MKKTIFFTILALFIMGISLSSFEDEEDATSAAYISKKYVLDELIKTNEIIIKIFDAAKAKDSTKIPQYLKDARIQYKHIEFYLQSFESDKTKFLNGAPLPWIEFTVGGYEHQDPHGLQVMEELIFDTPNIDFKALIEECYFFNLEILKFKAAIEINPVSDAIIFLGLKYGLINIETLSLSGFDCPITLQVSEEVNSSLETIKTVLSFYKQKNTNKSILKEIDSAQSTILKAQKYLQPSKNKYLEFGAIDQLYFIKKFLQPLNANIVNIFEHIKEQDTPPMIRLFTYITHIQGKVKNIYNSNFLNRMATGEKNYYGIDNKENLDPKIVALGEKLFSDVRLSHGNLLSCQSCHDPKLAFTDGLTTSKTNVSGVFQTRNSPTIVYSAYQGRQFYDLRSRTLEDQIVHVINNPDEFNTSFEEIIGKLNQDSALIQEFITVFPKDWKKPIKEFTIRKALGSFVRSLPQFNSEFDTYMRDEIKDLSPEVKRGFNLFMGKAKCGTCHFAPTFTGTTPPFYRESESEVVGMIEKWDTLHPILLQDSGRYRTQPNPIYLYSIKTPTLRNIGITGPYMVNGAFKDLETVMDFYNRGGGKGMGVNVPNQTLDSAPLNLTEQEIKDVIAFMNSLTDRQFLK